MKKSEIKKIEKWELKHKIIAFVLIFVFTIAIMRLIILIHDPNPILFGYELHHFYYGSLLLIFVTLFIIFGKERYAVYFTLSAISIGLIADEFFFVLGRKMDSQYF